MSVWAGSADGLKEKIAPAGMSPSVVDARLRSSYSSDEQLNWGPSALQQTSFKEEALANASAEGSATVWVGDESVHQALAPSLP